MKKIFLLFVAVLTGGVLMADISPNPIIIKGIYTRDSCMVRMVSETVTADLYKDSSRVECVFEMRNMGDDVTVEIGFPEMSFQYFGFGDYTEEDKSIFEISVDGRRLSNEDIQVPAEMERFYEVFRQAWEAKKTADQKGVVNVAPYYLMEMDMWLEYYEYTRSGLYPWYVWNESFAKGETKTIKVVYSMPSGMVRGAYYRYFHYMLSTGAGWYGTIGRADVILRLHDDIDMDNIEKVTPGGYGSDRNARTVSWSFTDLEPTKEDDIYLQYYNLEERERSQQRRTRQPSKPVATPNFDIPVSPSDSGIKGSVE